MKIPFYECHINAPIEVCESRDVKGLYKKARAGEIKNFTGISDPYEAPEQPEMDIKTHEMTLDQSVDYVLKRMVDDGILKDHSKKSVAPTLYETPTDDQKKEYESLKVVEINVE